MSIKMTSAAWELDLPMTDKMVLLVLCDHAHDNGRCWPSTGTIARKASCGERTVQRAMARLIDAGYLIKEERRGRSSMFTVDPLRSHPRQIDTPVIDDTEPPSQLGGPPPSQLGGGTVKEPSIEPSKKNIKKKVEKPTCVSEGVWLDFQALRKAKRAPLTQTALNGIEREALKAGWSLEDALAECSARGWQAFKASWVTEVKNGRATGRNSSASGDGFIRALDRKIAGDTQRGGLGESPRQVGEAGYRLAGVDQRGNGAT